MHRKLVDWFIHKSDISLKWVIVYFECVSDIDLVISGNLKLLASTKNEVIKALRTWSGNDTVAKSDKNWRYLCWDTILNDIHSILQKKEKYFVFFDTFISICLFIIANKSDMVFFWQMNCFQVEGSMRQ